MKLDFGAAWLWNRFRRSRLWLALRQINVFRSGVYLAIELVRTLREPQICNLKAVELEFKPNLWKYDVDATERQRFLDQTELLDSVRNGRLFGAGLEIGCAEGLYTEVIADRCDTLLVLDIFPVALDLAKRRRQWSNRVRFEPFDLRLDQIRGKFDLIVVGHVLDYFSRPTTFYRVRNKLIAAMKPGGYLLLTSPRVHPVVEMAWWGRYLIRGRWINEFMSRSHFLTVEASLLTEAYAITLYRRLECGTGP
jgi:SAM-dependent methyltransferase